ncbi:MAG: NHLP bacteriocin export ABC transporter permease/ATPase subunit [Desulfohalobiaceae bacterium]
MLESYRNQARRIEISGNSILVLNQPDSIYLVGSESVEVFAVPIREGRPKGVRRFLFSFGQDSLLFGLDTEDQDSELGLIVTGKPGSAVLEIPRSSLEEASSSEDPGLQDEVRKLVQGWIQSLLQALEPGLAPKDTVLLEPGSQELEPQQHARITPGLGQLWIRHSRGSSRYFSGSNGELSLQDEFLPLPEHFWITSKEHSSLQIISDQEYQLRDPGYSVLDHLNLAVLRYIRKLQEAAQQHELQRQAEMNQRDQARMASTMNLLAEAMEEGRRDSVAEAAGDELLKACIRVGQETGIEIHEPPAEARINTDPLQAIAKGSNFRMRQVALKGKWWKSDSGPMLGFLQDEQSGQQTPVALLQSSPGSYVLEDPRTGERRKVDAKSNEELSYFGYMFYQPMPYRPLKAMDLIRFSSHGMRRDLLMIMLMGIGAGLLGLLPPVGNGILFDTIIPDANQTQLLYVGAILVSAAISGGLFEAVKAVSTVRLSSKVERRIQSGVMDRLLALPTPFFRRFTAGDLADRTLSINAMREILSGVTLQSIMGGIFSSFSLALLFYYSWKLALVALGITLIAGGLMFWIGVLQVRYQRTIQRLQGKLQGMVLQFISGISKLRVSGTEDRAFSAWAETFSPMRKSTFKAAKAQNHLDAFTSSLRALSLLVIFGWIAFTSLLEQMSVGDIVAFNSAFAQFQMAMNKLAMTAVSSLQVVPMYERAKPILDAEPEVSLDKAGPGELTGHIEVNNANFRYDPDGPLILKDVSLEVQPGEFAAVVGGSGSGKSTLLRLLLGFEAPESGGVYYDSQDLDSLDVVAVRRQLGVVMQNSQLMSGDIFSNIVGSSNLSQEQAWEAARMAGLEEDIQNMPMGMHTMITPGGGTLSGGQRQRLLIARAIVHKPRILYFDEATSALDNKTQKTVSQSLEHLNSTRIVIAHRLSTIQNADKIFVLDRGRLVQQGDYQELVAQPGLFSELARRQIA